MRLNVLRTAIVIVYMTIAVSMGGYVGDSMASTEGIQLAIEPPTFATPSPYPKPELRDAAS